MQKWLKTDFATKFFFYADWFCNVNGNVLNSMPWFLLVSRNIDQFLTKKEQLSLGFSFYFYVKMKKWPKQECKLLIKWNQQREINLLLEPIILKICSLSFFDKWLLFIIWINYAIFLSQVFLPGQLLYLQIPEPDYWTKKLF